MKYLIFFIILLFPLNLFAKEPTLAEVIEWKYGFVANTKQKNINDISENPEMVISEWRHPSIAKPSDQQLAQDTSDYKAFLQSKKTAEQADEDAVKTKIKLNNAELKALKRSLEKV